MFWCEIRFEFLAANFFKNVGISKNQCSMAVKYENSLSQLIADSLEHLSMS